MDYINNFSYILNNWKMNYNRIKEELINLNYNGHKLNKIQMTILLDKLILEIFAKLVINYFRLAELYFNFMLEFLFLMIIKDIEGISLMDLEAAVGMDLLYFII